MRSAVLMDFTARVGEPGGPTLHSVALAAGVPKGRIVWAALQGARRPENKGRQIVAIAPSSSERYPSSWLFNDISIESDTLDFDHFGLPVPA